MPHRTNFLLSQLAPDILTQIAPHLSLVNLQVADVLAETHQRIEKVYFPHSGIISCVVELLGGDAIATGMVGNDGAFGACQALDDKVSLNHVVTQVAGVASIISADRLGEVISEFPPLRVLLIKYEEFLFSQVQQTAACNAVHNVQARTCKWLLRMHDLVGVDPHDFHVSAIGAKSGSDVLVEHRLDALAECRKLGRRNGFSHQFT